MQYTETKNLISNVLDIGEAMLTNGAEVSRVEDTLQRIFSSYGMTDIDVLTITSCIILTVTDENGLPFTQTRRIKTANIDYDRLSKLNTLSRFICSNKPSPEEIRVRLDSIISEKTSFRQRLIKKAIGSVLAASGFAVFFGGDMWDFAITSVVALLIVAFEAFFKRKDTNLPAYYFVCTLFAGIVTLILCRIFGKTDADMIMIGFIMLVIPGVAFTNSARDFLLGDTISGSLRMLESILYAAFIAAGVALSIVMMGGVA